MCSELMASAKGIFDSLTWFCFGLLEEVTICVGMIIQNVFVQFSRYLLTIATKKMYLS